MTCREKLKIEHPEYVGEKYVGGCKGCPVFYRYMDCPENCTLNNLICSYCWDREIPETAEKKGGSTMNKIVERIGKDEYYLGIAKAVSARSTCLRRQYGAIVVKDDRIISTGYNGSARGEKNCCDVGECWREAHGIPHGEQYEKCVGVHAEDNAISQAGREAIGGVLYLAGIENGKLIDAAPCLMCERKIKNAGIARVVCSKSE